MKASVDGLIFSSEEVNISSFLSEWQILLNLYESSSIYFSNKLTLWDIPETEWNFI